MAGTKAEAGTRREARSARPRLVREKQMAASMRGWRTEGTQSAASRAAGVARRTIGRWLRSDPAYKEAVNDAIEEYVAGSAQLAHCAITEHIERARARLPVLKGKRRDAKGVTEFHEVPELNPALAKLVLVRHDPRYAGAAAALAESVQETTAQYFERRERERKEEMARGERPTDDAMDAAMAKLRRQADENVVLLRAGKQPKV